MVQPPKGFVYNQEYGDWENPSTGEWFDPDTGQVHPPESSGQQSSSGNNAAGAVGQAATYAELANELWPSSTAQATQAAPSVAQSVAPAVAQSATPLAASYASSAPSMITSLSGTSAIPAAQAAAPAGMEATGQALGLAGDGVTGGMSVANSSAVGASQAANAAGTPWFDVGGPSYAGYLASAYSAYRGAKDFSKWKEQGDDYAATKAEQAVARTVGDYFTGGLASVADSGLRAVAPHFMNELDKFGNKYGPMGIVSRAFGSSKDKDQMNRDVLRKELRKTNFLDDKYNVTLADGNKWDMGVDGSHMLDNIGANIDGKNQRHTYDADFSDPRTAEAVGAMQGLGAIFSGTGAGKRKDQTTGLLTNAVLSSGDWQQNAMKLIADAGLNHDSAYGLIHQMSQETDKKKPKMEVADADAMKNALDKLYGVGAYANSGGPKKTTPTPKAPGTPAVATGATATSPMANKPKDTNVIPKAQPVIPRDPVGLYSPKTPKPAVSGAMTALGPKDNNVIPKAPKEAYTLAGTAANLVPTPKVDDRKKQQMVIPRFNSRVPLAAVRGSMQR